MSTSSLLSSVTKIQGQDTKILSIKDFIRSSSCDEGWAMHIDGSLRYKGQVVVPQSENLR